MTHKSVVGFIASTEPEKWPTQDEMPEVDISDLARIATENTQQELEY